MDHQHDLAAFQSPHVRDGTVMDVFHILQFGKVVAAAETADEIVVAELAPLSEIVLFV